MASSISGIDFTLTEDDDMNAVIYQGCDLYFVLTMQDSDGEPVDVTGWSAAMTLRSRANADEKVGEFTEGNGRVVVGGVDGMIEFSMDETSCAALEAGAGVYDIRVTKADGFSWQAQSGKYEIVRSVTR